MKTRAKIWIYSSEHASWYFVTLSTASARNLLKQAKKQRRGWGSIPVVVTVGKSVWKTSVFPNADAGGYILPVKAKVRKAEGIEHGQTVSFAIEFDRWK
ncbi:DUF1905 domain-containing protein [Candidatus Uhrbacteria bacterium CG10_big_fil_rev_8_21_14_0_10_48_16]|uniref:DUF1905 domain-containing protein n=1 Tax=Candidatus Uhrbacteria bacterium CG10_big_fil_rev_8_21_14_0_10_48_16 TaxID=1975038 RepID=A0A2M8LG27_9BACT|nr:MAG: DUF1905 domain-containing protein [Candidatus Uhrbacteria bacterium CG10_big_fil_rev_8_21_14_0_10_48_16]